MIKKMICVSCPKGCEMSVSLENGKLNSVNGNSCKRGLEYAKNEIENPKRMLTTTVKVHNGAQSLLPVRTQSPIPKTLLKECMEKINAFTVEAPIALGDTVIPDILHTGIDIIAAKPVLRGKKTKAV